MDPIRPWTFIDNDGTFRLSDPQRSSYLYFPLVNEAGMISVITPTLHGDVKTDQHTFLLPPTSVEDLHASRAARNFWVYVAGAGAWSATGSSATQQAAPEAEQVTLEAGFLWHKLTRANPQIGLRAEITSFVPAGAGQVELMKVTLTNIATRSLALTPTAAIPLYGRSADNLRDHRHVTSLLHRARCGRYGVLLRPALSFDERGHHPNATTYAVLGAEDDCTAPVGFFPALEDFVGEGGTLDWPEAAVRPLRECQSPGATLDGYETIGALRFREVTLEPGEAHTYLLVLAILPPNPTNPADWGESYLVQTYASLAQFDALLDRTRAFWQSKLSTLSIASGNAALDGWLKWVTLQPVLRRMFGNSFLPYHDYGRGGRGWRDLWQDILALLLMEPGPVDDLLFSNYAGVRLDGSNATIIGSRPGEFKADRNNIPRVWMDHGLWPLTTTQLYIDQSGDLGFLLRPQAYFKDSHTRRCHAMDAAWDATQGTQQHTDSGALYQGSVFEHLLIQHLTAFFNVGEHNNILLEGADWNDGMDMARQRGESVAFSAFYASNLRQLGRLALELQSLGNQDIELLAELLPLLDTLSAPVDYGSPSAKQARLGEYFATVQHTVSGQKARVTLADLAADLTAKADWMAEHLRQQEWVQDQAGYGWFNGYYDNDGQRLEGDHPNGVRMTLTGQVFALMGEIASPEQVREVLRAADHYLYDPRVGGYRLNTNFGEVLLNMGRCFGFAYGHKENGAVFSHMAVMFAYALYQRGLARPAYRTLDSLYRQSVDFGASRIYPGIPEYFSERGRGMYPYLTGSASWYLLTLVTQAFGVRGQRGDLLLAPMLVKEQFGPGGEASLTTLFAGRKLTITYHNPGNLDAGEYQIQRITLDGQILSGGWTDQALLAREVVTALGTGEEHKIEVTLGD
jgi:cellobiose phosphorylase